MITMLERMHEAVVLALRYIVFKQVVPARVYVSFVTELVLLYPPKDPRVTASDKQIVDSRRQAMTCMDVV